MPKKVKCSRVGKWDIKIGKNVLPPFYLKYQIRNKI